MSLVRKEMQRAVCANVAFVAPVRSVVWIDVDVKKNTNQMQRSHRLHIIFAKTKTVSEKDIIARFK